MDSCACVFIRGLVSVLVFTTLASAQRGPVTAAEKRGRAVVDEALKALGIQLAIDDFGTGYSSLGYLKRFPVDTLKIDRSFVERIGVDIQDAAIVQSVVALAKTLNLSVVGEGIESRAQAAQLLALGCDRGQGFLFARPQSAEAITALLHKDADFKESAA